MYKKVRRIKLKKIKDEYKEVVKYFLKNKFFMCTIIIVAILSFGFTITHHSVGVDDTCLDRYYTLNSEYSNTNMITAGRWGSFILYYVLDITSFTPFWLDCITTLLIIATAITCCIFIKKQCGEKYGIMPYIIFSCVYISYPMINEPFIFQASNLAVALSTWITIVLLIYIYENYFNLKNNKMYIIIIPILATVISMYESCCQAYIVLMFGMILLRILLNKNESILNIIKFVIFNAVIMILSIILNYIILNMFYLIGFENNLAGSKDIYWSEYSVLEGIKYIIAYIKMRYSRDN